MFNKSTRHRARFFFFKTRSAKLLFLILRNRWVRNMNFVIFGSKTKKIVNEIHKPKAVAFDKLLRNIKNFETPNRTEVITFVRFS